MRRFYGLLRLAICTFLLTIGQITVVWSVPYASGVRNTDGANWEFVLNEAADSVTVLRDGGNALTIPGTVGRHSFSMTGFTNFSIEVSKSAPAAWTSITDPNNLFDDFTLPTGLGVVSDPSNLAYFGTVYVGNGQPVATKSLRQMGDGIYALTADMKGVSLPTFAAVTDRDDTTQAKAPGFVVAGSNNSPFRINFDDSGNLLISDWSDGNGGVKYASRDLTMGGLVLGGVDISGNPVPESGAGTPGTGPSGGILSRESDEFGPIPLHGSVGAKVYSTGTVGVDLTLWVMDEDLDKDLAVPNNDTNSIWRHDVGAATEYDATAPTLVVNSLAIPPTSDGRSNFIGAFGSGVATGMFYSEQYGKWYINQPRTDGNQSSVTILSAALDGSEADSPVVEWSSLQFTIDSALDGDAVLESTQDVFRRVRDLVVSPDGKYLVLHRNGVAPTNGILGPGAVLLVSLDENGLPDIQVDGGVITNVIDITTLGNNGAHNSGAQVEFDAAGNLYVANSAISTTSDDPLLTGQLIQVFSPGGNWKAITNSDGTFSLQPLTSGGVLGDYNGNGTVDAADYVIWRNGGPLLNESASPGTIDDADYTFWRSRFGANSGAGAQATIPEPGSLAMCLVGVIAALWKSPHRRK